MPRPPRATAFVGIFWTFSWMLSISAIGCTVPPRVSLVRQAQVEVTISSLAREISETPSLDVEKAYGILTEYLKKNPRIFGAAFAFAPVERDGGVFKSSPYVYRKDNELVRRNAAEEGIDYVDMEWYAVPIKEQKSAWSRPYFDVYGGEIDMVTYSIPVYTSGTEKKLLGVVTSDLPVE
jgi:sigma-B regulation protein RsbU (phosphoserine phosphatase)